MRFWHKADMPDVSLDVRFRGQSGHLNAQIEFFRFWTQSGHWLCAARIVSILSKASVSGDAMLSSELGNRYAATRVHHAGRWQPCRVRRTRSSRRVAAKSVCSIRGSLRTDLESDPLASGLGCRRCLETIMTKS